MGIKLGDAIVYLRGDSTDLDKDLGTAERKTNVWARTVSTAVGTAVGGIVTGGISLAADAVVGLGREFSGLVVDALPLQGIQTAFQGITKDADATLQTLRTGALGMVTDAELMQTYNNAFQLVGENFANQLPEAMQYLSKVSAATGQDMGFLLDSLTKGVGRLSPMILDNLAIQVDVTEANEAYAASLGKSSSELTKQEQQAALMAQVLEKLAENTADMPDITDNASTAMAQWNTTIQNLKDSFGTALLPALTQLAGKANELITRYGPDIERLLVGFGQWAAANIPIVIDWLENAFKKVNEFSEGGRKFMAMLRSAWDNDLMGIRTTLERVWNESLQPALAKLDDMFRNRVIPIVDKLRNIWETRLIPILARFGIQVGSGIIPLLGEGLVQVIDKAVWWIERMVIGLEGLIAFMDKAGNAISRVANFFRDLWQKIQDVRNAVSNLSLPDWLTPGSPTPLELGLVGINKQISELAKMGNMSIGGGFSAIPAAAGVGATGGGTTINGLSISFSLQNAPHTEREAQESANMIRDELRRRGL